MDRNEKRQRRIEAYRAKAERARNESLSSFKKSESYVSGIPMGQPILVGHHSEKGHRRAIKRSWDALGKSVELDKKAEYYEAKAEAAENNTNIYLEDDNAVQDLELKIEKLKKEQETMKAVNKICKSKKLTEKEKTERLKEEFKISEKSIQDLLTECYYGFGYPSFMLTNNNARLKQAQKQLEKAKYLKETDSKEYEINEIKIVENTDLNRVQILFGYKPSEEVRKELKRCGFRWSPTNEAWQAHLSRWNIDRAKEIVNM